MSYIDKNEYAVKDNPVSKQSSTQDDMNPDVQSWLIKLAKAEKEAKEWATECDESWREYLAKNARNQYFRSLEKNEERFNLHWSNIQTQCPLLYSKTPVVICNRAFDNSDPVARVASMLIERLATQMIREPSFDNKMKEAAKEFLLTSRVSLKVKYDATFEKYEVDEGFQEDDSANENPIEEVLERECISVVNLSYKDILFTYGLADEDKITWKAFRLLMSKQEAYDLFGDIAKELNYSSKREKDYEGTEEEVTSELACIWEIWDKRTKKVYYVSKTSRKDFLKVIEDPYDLADFFPDTPFLFSTKAHDSLFPVPDFTETYDLYSTLHVLYKRIKGLIRAIRARGIYDKSVDDLVMLISEAVQDEFIGVDMGAVASKGGLANVVQFFPTDTLAKSLTETFQTFLAFQDLVYNVQGISDIMRGASDPETTASAEKIKQRFASIRFSLKQKGFQELVKQAIQKMVDLALYRFSGDTLYRMMGVAFLDQLDQQYVPAAIELLKSDRDRMFRIDIETDSTILFKEEEEKQLKLEMLNAIGGFLQNAASLIQAQPLMAPAIISLLLSTVRSFRFSKDSEAEIEQSLQSLLQQVSQPPAPPPPDPMVQIQMQKMQLEGQKIQLEAQKIQSELALDAQRLRVEENKAYQLEAEANMNASIATRELQIKEYEAQIEQSKLALNQQSEQANQQLEMIRMQLEKQEKDLAMYEKFIEEQRLQMENLKQPEQMKALYDELAQSKEAMNVAIGAIAKLLEQRRKPRIANITRDPITGSATVKLIHDEETN